MTDAAHHPEAAAFTGIRIVELAGGIPGPYATMFLADHGADVIKVEPAGGDPYRSEPGFYGINRNKRSVVCTGSGELTELLASADVIVVEVPGAAAELRKSHPGAIIVSFPPWGERGPNIQDPATPDLLAAATGVFWNQQSYTEAPVALVLPVVAYGTAMLGALAIASGLLVRERTNAAPTYEVSWLAGSAAMQIGETQLDGNLEDKPGSSPMGSKGRMVCYRLFEAADGHWFFVACGTPRFFERLLQIVERPDLLGDPRLPAPPFGLISYDAIELLAPILEDAFRSRSRADWLAALAAADIPAQPVWTREEYLQSSLARANEVVGVLQHPDLGAVRVPGVALVVESAPGSLRSAAPGLGEHTGQIEAHVPARGHGQGGPPLQGYRVLDLASFIAGPVVSRHLAMLGAEVIKVEPPAGDSFRTIGAPFFAWNQGKRSIALDLTTPDGQGHLASLAKRADAAIENCRPGVAFRLGADAATLQAINPALVHLSSTGYGDDQTMAGAPAFDPLLQALGGIMAAQGGMVAAGDGAEPVFLTVAIHDVATPLLSAFGVVTAWFDQARTGRQQRVRTSLARAAIAVQAAEVTQYAGSPEPAVGGWDFPGRGALHTWFEDGDALYFRDGDAVVEVGRQGLVCQPAALANDLSVCHDYPGIGRIWQGGQLVGGAGPHPFRAPALDEHRIEILAELEA